MKNSQYKDFYYHPVTLPIKGLRGQKINVSMLMTGAIFILISTLLVNVLSFGSNTLFGIAKLWYILGLSSFLIFLSTQIEAYNYPFFYYLGSFVKFLVKRINKVSYVNFVEVNKEPSIQYVAPVQYRNIQETEEELLYYHYPLKGTVRSIEGLSIEVEGATRITYSSLTRNLTIGTGNFEKLSPQEKPVSRIKGLDMEIGRGRFKFVHKNGKTKGVYKPILEGDQLEQKKHEKI